MDTFLLSFDFPVMGCPWPTCNALIVTGFKLLSIPNLDKVREQLTWRLWWKIREKHIFLFLQPGRKLIILREIVITGQLLKLVCLKKLKKIPNISNLIQGQQINLNTIMARHYTIKMSYPVHKAPTFAGSWRCHGR